jgi:replicative DNA helicase
VSIVRSIERIPPQNLDAEQSVLGSMLLDRDAIARVVEVLRPEDFYRDLHRTIYVAMLDLFERGEPVDLVTVTNRLSGMGKLEDVGGATYLAALPNTVPTAANSDFYAGIVLEKSMLRSLISAGTQIAALGYEGMDEVTALIDQAEKLVYGISSRRNMQDFQTIKEILKASFEKIDKRYQEKGTVTGVATGFTDFDMLTSGLQPADMVIVAARPSVGKCLAFDSEILLADGAIATIEEVYRRRGCRLLTLGNDWKFRIAEPSDFVDDGIKPVYRVTTRLGRTVECTEIHPFRTIGGWLPLSALRVGDRVAVPRKIEVFGAAPMRECEIKLLAYFIGDGSPTGNTATATQTDPRIAEDFQSAVEAFGAVCCRQERDRSGSRAPSFAVAGDYEFIARHREGFAAALRQVLGGKRGVPERLARRHEGDPSSLTNGQRGATVSSEARFDRLCSARSLSPSVLAPHGLASLRRNRKNTIALWLIHHGLWGKSAAHKQIPSAIFSLPRDQLALFLNRLFATDGWARVTPTSGLAQIGYCSISARLAKQVQHLLLRFGIIAALRRKSFVYKATRRSAWSLYITDPASIKIFSDVIGMFGKESQLAEVIDTAASRRRKPSAGTMRDPRLEDSAAGDVYWDEIESIEPSGLKHVYDLSISETHNFVANDICVHNTTLALNISQHAAIAHKIPVAIFSLETSKEQLVQRILCSEARVDNTKLRTGFLADEDWRKLARAMGGLSEAPIFIDDSATLSVMEMRAKARKLRAEHGLGLVVIDYIQMIQSYKRSENRTQELSEISRGIKSLAKELDLPIIAVSQLSRAVETLGSKRPMLSHLRESGEIEQVADLVIFLYREDYYDMEKAQKENKENICEVIIAKHRNGPIGSVELFFHKEYSRFANLERRR